MLIWVTIQVFQGLYRSSVQDESLSFLRFLGFIELLIELAVIIVMMCVAVHDKFINKESSDEQNS